MIRALMIAASLVAAVPAGALTCAPPDDPLDVLREVLASPEYYAVLHGRLDFDASLMPESGGPNHGGTRQPPPVPARFEGLNLDSPGWHPVTLDLTLIATCAGPWCGSVTPGDDWLLFAPILPGGRFEIEIGPCGGWLFESPSAAVLDLLASCIAAEAAEGGSCSS